MESFIGWGSFLFVIGVIAFSRYFRSHDNDWQTQNDEVMEKEEKKYDMENPDTLGLMYNTLCNIGCQPTKKPDDTIIVKYQGENFHIEFGGMYARVWDPFWAEVKVDDPDLPKIKEAINKANFNFCPTVVFTNPDEEGVISLLSRRDIMLHPACPDNVPFVKAVLDSFFDAKNEVKSNYQKLSAKQSDNQQSRRPVGFATYNQ